MFFFIIKINFRKINLINKFIKFIVRSYYNLGENSKAKEVRASITPDNQPSLIPGFTLDIKLKRGAAVIKLNLLQKHENF